MADNNFSKEKKFGKKKYEITEEFAKNLGRRAEERKKPEGGKSQYGNVNGTVVNLPNEDDEWLEHEEKEPDLTGIQVKELVLDDEEEVVVEFQEGKEEVSAKLPPPAAPAPASSGPGKYVSPAVKRAQEAAAATGVGLSSSRPSESAGGGGDAAKGPPKHKNTFPEPEIAFLKDHLQPARDMKGVTRKGTGVVYDIKMLEHHCTWDPNYPEKPERLSGVLERCNQLGLLDRCKILPSRPATKAEILTLHTEQHIEALKSICKVEDPAKMEEFSSHYDAINVHPSTYDLSLLSVGSTIDLVDSILAKKIQNGMAIIRPPGHHAMKAEYCGNCYFNNVAIAARKALDSRKASRVLIVDFDVYHGQATQQMFYEDRRVLYFSTHRYEHGKFWQNLVESDYNFIGSSSGVGFNCNVPLNKTGLGNADFLTIWHQLLLPLAYEFNPDLVIVSAGYDCVYGCFEFDLELVLVSAGFDSLTGDEKGEMELTPQCCPHLIWPLLGLAGGKVAVILEGGYCIKSLAEGAALTLRSLLDDPCPLIPKIENPSPVVAETILNCNYMLRSYWTSLRKRQPEESSLVKLQEKGVLHIPTLKFEWNETKPLTYATRDCYPIQNSELKRTIDEKLDALSLSTNLKKSKHKVGLVYDDIMLQHRNLQVPGHPECPQRISNIFANHADYGLLERVLRIHSREATEEELLLIHTSEHIELMKMTGSSNQSELRKLQSRFNSIYFNNSSYKSALISAGSVLQVVDNVLEGNCQSGVAIVRPPGHHAEEGYPCGFCIFNNVALAAKYALEVKGLKRIMIVDWDVHHGNGIQRMFESDPRALYISIHRYDNGSFFPCSPDANYNVVGTGPGTGFTVNIPWNAAKMGDTEYLAVFNSIVLPIGYEFAPELVLVSAGFDAAKGDPLGGCSVTPEGYGHMTHLLRSLANGRIIVALEGGYNLTSIAYSMVMVTRALFGDPLPPLTLNRKLHPSALQSIEAALDTQASYWTVLAPFRKVVTPARRLIPKGSYDGKTLDEKMSEMKLNANTKSKLKYAKIEVNKGVQHQGQSSDNQPKKSIVMPPKQIPEPTTDASVEPGVRNPETEGFFENVDLSGFHISTGEILSTEEVLGLDQGQELLPSDQCDNAKGIAICSTCFLRFVTFEAFNSHSRNCSKKSPTCAPKLVDPRKPIQKQDWENIFQCPMADLHNIQPFSFKEYKSINAQICDCSENDKSSSPHFVCHLCQSPKNLNNYKEFNKHAHRKHVLSKKGFECPYKKCPYHAFSKEEVRRHWTAKHKDAKMPAEIKKGKKTGLKNKAANFSQEKE